MVFIQSPHVFSEVARLKDAFRVVSHVKEKSESESHATFPKLEDLSSKLSDSAVSQSNVCPTHFPGPVKNTELSVVNLPVASGTSGGTPAFLSKVVKRVWSSTFILVSTDSALPSWGFS